MELADYGLVGRNATPSGITVLETAFTTHLVAWTGLTW